MLDPLDSYLYGLILTDGSIYLTSRNRGKICIELNRKDKELLQKIQTYVPECRIRCRMRNTNFKQHVETAILNNYKKAFREKFIGYGIPVKDKSIVGTIPNQPYSVPDFWRGVYDGNGSIGFTKANEPFISLVTKSTPLKQELLSLLFEEFRIIKHINQNQRDHVYNIVLKNEDAIQFGNFIYNNADIFMQRKYNNYIQFQNWKRTSKKSSHRRWTLEEIAYIQTHTIEESKQYLHRSTSSIKTQLWRLKQK